MTATDLIVRKGVSVLIQRPGYTYDSALSPIRAWATVGRSRAFIQPESGSESQRYGRDSSRRFSNIFLPAGTDIRNGDRIKYGARIFDIETPFNPGEFLTGRLAHIQLSASETDQHAETISQAGVFEGPSDPA